MSNIDGSVATFRGIGGGMLPNLPSTGGGSSGSAAFIDVGASGSLQLDDATSVTGTATVDESLLTVDVYRYFKLEIDSSTFYYAGAVTFAGADSSVSGDGTLIVSMTCASLNMPTSISNVTFFANGANVDAGQPLKATFVLSGSTIVMTTYVKANMGTGVFQLDGCFVFAAST